MRKKTLCLNLAAIAMFAALGLKMYNQHPISSPAKDITMANIEAILGNENGSDPEKGSTDPEKGTTDPEKGSTDPEKGTTDPEKGNTGSLDTSYKRSTSNCVFRVAANAEIKLIGFGIFKADGNGEVSIPGQVTCIGGGNETCKPSECVDIIKIIMGAAN